MEKCNLNADKPYLPQYWAGVSYKLILICFIILFCSSPVWSDDKTELKQLRRNLKTLQDNLSGTKHSKQKAIDALHVSEQAISRSNRKLKQLDQNKKAATVALKVIGNKLSQTQKNIEFERKQLGQLLYQQYLSSQKDNLRLLLNQENPNQATRNLHYYKHLSHARTTSMAHLNKQLSVLEELKQDQKRKMEDIATIQAKYAVENNLLRQEKIKRKAILTKVSGQLTNQQKKITALKRSEKRLYSLVDQIGKLLAKKKPSGGLYNDKLPGNTQKNKSFSALKGQLRLPIRGKLFNRFGSPRSGRYITWEGLFIKAPSGSDIKVIANGQVVFANWLKGFGNLIIVDHGKSYMSLYGNNETLFRQVGDIIKVGDIIATVGNSGSNIESGLYFELRHRGKPFDPLTWIKTD